MERVIQRYIAPKTGACFSLPAGRSLKVIDLEGEQVADMIAFNEHDRREKLSTAATIDMNASLRIGEGDFFYSNLYNRMMRVVEDSSGRHDLLHPACSPSMYRAQYGIYTHHPSCLENLLLALRRQGMDAEDIPNPVNLFMNTRIHPDGRVEVRTPCTGPGDFITFGAEVDLLIGVAACSVEESFCNGWKCTPILVEIVQPSDDSCGGE
jgi:uncharacterized protein YcgI (DUF1989 family)